MPRVIVKKSSYQYAALKKDVSDMLSALDNGIIKPGSKVLIKPNLLAASPPEAAITTHPLVIKAVAEYVLDNGGRPTVSDSPPLDAFRKIIKLRGMEEALKGLPVEVKEFRESVKVKSVGRIKNLEVAGEALEADVVINLPKLKTHAQMGLTLAVKNLFGSVIGMRKPEWHYRVGEDKGLFAELLLSIYLSIKPRINLVDGILAMEGNGPGTGGTPRELGVLIAGEDALSLDVAITGMLGLEPSSVPVNKRARELGLPTDFELSGDGMRVEGFKLPRTEDLLFGPRLSRKLLRKHITLRPESVGELCKGCMECAKMCPAGAISGRKGGTAPRLTFDYEKCIRCYCCMEVCPFGAIKTKEPLLRKALKKIAGR